MNQLAQIIGIGLILGISGAALYVASDPRRWWSMGRIALVSLATYQSVFAFSRMMRLFGWWEPHTMFAFNTIMAGAFLAIFVNLIAINELWRRHGLPIPQGAPA